MHPDPTTLADKTRTSALSGVVVALAAAVGGDYALSASAVLQTQGSSTGAAIRVVLPPKPVLSLAAAGLACGAVAIVLLMLRRPSPVVGCATLMPFVIPTPVEPSALAMFIRRFGISHRTGGLYGP